ncbi:acetate/propionate family kinase [Lentisalinibacter orientalis]|uniref:acetate/propionate family kinase n=1 Tax=Lentisalinibacter orientalis TaxID=2992241 RepID=UPI00386CF6C4
MSILVLNSGSSSIKIALFDAGTLARIGRGAFERIGTGDTTFSWRTDEARAAPDAHDARLPMADHRRCLEYLFDALPEIAPGAEPTAIGHRVVHGGDRFAAAVRVDAAVLATIEQTGVLAPVHNPLNRLGMEVAGQRYPDTPQVAVFDTAFHQTIPPMAWHYALPQRIAADRGIRRYGFHGTSHQFLARRAADILGRALGETRLITLHLGNGASAAAVRGGTSVDTSMGMTPLEGLVMGTRCGDLDPSVVTYLQREAGMSAAEVDELLNGESGLRGLAGVNDMREIHRLRAAGHEGAQLAFEVFCYRVKKYIGAYLAVLGGADAIVFSGGIGENDAAVRQQCIAGLEGLGIVVDPVRNRQAGDGGAMHEDGASVALLVIQSDEEAEIARETLRTLASGK